MKSKKLYRSRRTRVILSWDCSVEQTRAKTRSEESEYRESTWTRPSRYYFSTRLFSIYDDEKKEKEKKRKKRKKRKEKKEKNIFMWIAHKWKSSRRDRSRVGIAAESSNRKNSISETRKILFSSFNLIARPFTLRLRFLFFISFYPLFLSIDG